MNPGSQGLLVPQMKSGTIASTCQLVTKKSEGVTAGGTNDQLDP